MARTNRKTTTQDTKPIEPHGNRNGVQTRRPPLKPARLHNSELLSISSEEVLRLVLKKGGRSSDRSAPPGFDRHRPTSLTDGKPKRSPLRFIDLFCGIGGFRIAFERAGASCVFSSDWDRFSRQTYAANFGEEPAGDINAIPVESIPAFDILCAGFPCQPFSLAGVSKKNSLGRKHGFEDERQGNLFFAIADILKHHQPKAFVLENVKHLTRHDKGRTFQIIRETLTEKLGYTLYTNVIDAASVVPQHRERIFLVGFRPARTFDFPRFPRNGPKLKKILERRVPQKYTLTDHLWNYLQNYAKKHQDAGNGFGFSVFGPGDVTRTLSARYHKDGSEILVSQGPKKNPRRLTPRECARLMGYPDTMIIPVSDTQAYRQFGNSVVVPVVERIARKVLASLAGQPNRDDVIQACLFDLPAADVGNRSVEAELNTEGSVCIS
jgi:DNA (cytosine-5)-methyltransferase 1